MSEGPISQERRGHATPPVSIPDSQRVCARQPGATLLSECGRKRAPLAATPEQVSCPDCLAAIRADAEKGSS